MMDNCFVVCGGYYEDYGPECVFSSMESAEQYITSQIEKYAGTGYECSQRDYYRIQAFELDKP